MTRSLSLGAGTVSQTESSPSQHSFSGLAAVAPGDLRAWELSVPSTHLPFVNCRIHRELDGTSQCHAFSWILCHLAACRQLCKTARSFLTRCQCRGVWNSASVFPFLFPPNPLHFPPKGSVAHFSQHSLSTLQALPFKFRVLQMPPLTLSEIKKSETSHSGRGSQSARSD